MYVYICIHIYVAERLVRHFPFPGVLEVGLDRAACDVEWVSLRGRAVSAEAEHRGGRGRAGQHAGGRARASRGRVCRRAGRAPGGAGGRCALLCLRHGGRAATLQEGVNRAWSEIQTFAGGGRGLPIAIHAGRVYGFIRDPED